MLSFVLPIRGPQNRTRITTCFPSLFAGTAASSSTRWAVRAFAVPSPTRAAYAARNEAHFQCECRAESYFRAVLSVLL